ncbi:hypothetical protein LRS73_04210 [Methylobacterium currus]|uniref:hypothetical protein n=1 Tax=Methylobacterium currus TaxID=2051553 RepID=UPI001E38A24D|nr:hypothetical protein [Methylobacterium currus]UHC17126.1 hypothetical protein LRS73_04210 [Methylobacterium currus]
MRTMRNPMTAGKRLLAVAALVAGGLLAARTAEAAPFALGAGTTPAAEVVQVQYGHHHGWGHRRHHDGWGHRHHGGWGHHRHHHGHWGHHHHRHGGHHHGRPHHRGHGFY